MLHVACCVPDLFFIIVPSVSHCLIRKGKPTGQAVSSVEFGPVDVQLEANLHY